MKGMGISLGFACAMAITPAAVFSAGQNASKAQKVQKKATPKKTTEQSKKEEAKPSNAAAILSLPNQEGDGVAAKSMSQEISDLNRALGGVEGNSLTRAR